MERLYGLYEAEVKQREKDGCLARATAHTYLVHSGNFVDWCKGEFIPGRMGLQNRTKP